jgi:hypothetical protein
MSLSIHDAFGLQQLNNRAANCIACGRYSLAISSLFRALKLLETANDESAGCSCRHCSLLEACLAFSEKTSSRRLFQSSTFTSSSSKHHPIHRQQTSDELSSEDGYIYRQPIRVTSQSTRKGHSIGPAALLLILTFNLGLAHHLSAMEDKQVSRTRLQRVLQLYELAYRYQMEEKYEQVDCIMFTMIISNNLGEIHRVMNNHTKHVLCLEHLLSMMMFVVECKHNNYEDSLELELDGFLRNTCQLILQGQCAGAA